MYYYFIALAAAASIASVVFGWAASYVSRRTAEIEGAEAQTRIEREKAETVQRLERDKMELHTELNKLRETLDQNTELVFKAMNIKQEVWQPVKIDSVPSSVADYIMLLFRTDRGRVTGKVRVKGTSVDIPFSTTANKDIPVSIPNVWDPIAEHYTDPTIIEFTISNTTEPPASLSILTKGWIDTRGREPHL